MRETKHDWLCPWCQAVARLPGNPAGICESRRCGCGALGIAAPARDTDEIIDDAIGVFGIPEGSLTPFDADRVAGLQQLGVEVAEGEPIPAGVISRFELRVLWFRKQ
jgi:hypothetical protein